MEQTEELIEREFLCGKRVRTRKKLDIPAIYADFDKGMTWEDVCLKYEASESTIRRHHKQYQEMVKALKEEKNELPLLPSDM